MKFKQYKQLNEGGNLTLDIDGKELEAQKIDMTKSTRKEFKKLSINMFKEINIRFKKAYGKPLWIDEKRLYSGELFNGSTSFIFSDDYPDEEIMKHKTSSGDIDVIIPREKAADLWDLLKILEGKEILPDVVYKGNNRKSNKSLANQINAIFVMHFKNGYKVPAQVDFEMLSVDVDGKPDEFARFSHSSTFEDLTIGQKGVSSKYLLISLGGAISKHENVIIVTPASTKDKYTVKTVKGRPVTSFTDVKFSVDKGLRTSAFDKQDWQIDGKSVFKEIPVSKSTYIQDLSAIFEVLFGKKPSKTEIKMLWSYKGLISLMKKYLNKKQILLTYDRMISRTIAKGAQPLERDSAELDYSIKDSMLGYFEKQFKMKRSKDIIAMMDEYYATYR